MLTNRNLSILLQKAAVLGMIESSTVSNIAIASTESGGDEGGEGEGGGGNGDDSGGEGGDKCRQYMLYLVLTSRYNVDRRDIDHKAGIS